MGIFLETKRLVLKTLEYSDLPLLIALRTDEDVMQYTGECGAQTVAEVKEYLNISIPYQRKYGLGFCAVFKKINGEFIGKAGLFHLLFDPKLSDIEINYHLHKKFWGNGYATELVKALVSWAFHHLPVQKLVASSYPENEASQKVLKKAGFDLKNKIVSSQGLELLWYEIYKNDAIELVSYNKEWSHMADLEIKKLYEVLPAEHILDIQHVGSTAIPGMLAKPIIDIQIAVKSLSEIKQAAIDALKILGYEYWAENPDPERMFFVKGMPPFGERRTHHVHIVEPISRHWDEKIQFRDYLLVHPEAASEYACLKKILAEQYQYDRELYTDSKKQFVNNIVTIQPPGEVERPRLKEKLAFCPEIKGLGHRL
jgi:GrpB-like predicted nucleotidyltransferase (UPF0157 family)/RimJ/RimL family protein N-acetyltransferase